MVVTKGLGRSLGAKSHAQAHGACNSLARRAAGSKTKVARGVEATRGLRRNTKHVLRASAESETSNWQNWAPADESGSDGEVYEVREKACPSFSLPV